MSSLRARLDELLLPLTLDVSEHQREQLVGYVQWLDKWNKTYNLTSVRDPYDMLVKHILDSLVVSPYLSGQRCIDVGTGPGLPGIPLAIMNPDKEFVLLDSLGKRIRFIKQVIHALQIVNVEAVQSRVEEFDPKQGFDIVLSRAFASMSDMLHWCQHLPRAKTGLFLALKGQVTQAEIQALPEWCCVNNVKPLHIPALEGERHLVILSRKGE